MKYSPLDLRLMLGPPFDTNLFIMDGCFYNGKWGWNVFIPWIIHTIILILVVSSVTFWLVPILNGLTLSELIRPTSGNVSCLYFIFKILWFSEKNYCHFSLVISIHILTYNVSVSMYTNLQHVHTDTSSRQKISSWILYLIYGSK